MRNRLGACRVGIRFEFRYHLVERSYAGQAVAADEVVVEERQGQSGNEGVYPDGQPGEFHSYAVAVHTVDAVPGYLASDQRTRLDVNTNSELAQGSERRVSAAG